MADRPTALDGGARPPPIGTAWLVGPEGRTLVDEVTARATAGDSDLAIGAWLRTRVEPAHAALVAEAAAVRRRLVADRPDADRLLFTREAAEQASHPAVAAWRAERLAGPDLVLLDATAGAGGDSLAFAARGATVIGGDRDISRLHLLRHNATVSAADVTPLVGDALTPPVRRVDAAFADPARRVGARRVRGLSEHVPPVAAVTTALATVAARGGTVVAPGFDLDDPTLPAGMEVEFVQVGDTLTEAVLWWGDAREPGVRARATLLPGRHSRSRAGEPATLPVGAPGEWLVVPAPALVRARLHDELGEGIGARRLARRRALLSVDARPPASPWWRVERILAALPPRTRPIRAWLRANASELPVEVVVHGVATDVGAWHRRLQGVARGPRGVALHLVRLDEGAVALVTDRRPGAAA